MDNTDHRGNPIGKPHIPTTQSSQMATTTAFSAPNAGISASLDSAPSGIIKTKGLGDSLREAGASYAEARRDQMFQQRNQEDDAEESFTGEPTHSEDYSDSSEESAPRKRRWGRKSKDSESSEEASDTSHASPWD